MIQRKNWISFCEAEIVAAKLVKDYAIELQNAEISKGIIVYQEKMTSPAAKV